MSVVLDGSTQYGGFNTTNGQLYHQTQPHTLAVWFKPSGALSTKQYIAGTDTRGNTDRSMGLTLLGDDSNKLAYETRDGSRWTTLLNSSATNNAWNVGIYHRGSGNPIPVTGYLNADDGTATGNVYSSDTGESTAFRIGCRLNSGIVEPFAGKIAAYAIWNRILTGGEIDSLQGGALPSTISSGLVDSLVISGSGTASTLATTGGFTMSFTGSPTLDADTPWLSFSVDTIDDPIEAGDSFSYTTSGFSSLTAITTDKSGVTVSGISGVDGTATLSGWNDAALYPALPSSVQFTFTDGTNNATKNSNISVPVGYTRVPVTAPDLIVGSTIGKAILAATGRTIVAGDIQYHTVYSDLVVTGTTGYSVTGSGTFDYWLWVSSGGDAGKMYQYAVTVSDGSISVGGGLTSSGLTSSGLTSSGLTIAAL